MVSRYSVVVMVSAVVLGFLLVVSSSVVDVTLAEGAVIRPKGLEGYFETPNYSSRRARFRYPNNRDEEWRFSLQKGESIKFIQTGETVQFGSDDYMKLFVNETDMGRFSTSNSSKIWATVNSPDGSTSVSLRFHSGDSGMGRGLRGNFSITCISDEACHHVGKCQPRRDVDDNHAGMSCECAPGFAGDRCEGFADCPGRCHPGSTCVKATHASTPFCVCTTPGYFSDQNGACMDIDECQHDVCDPDSTCVNSPGSFSCECKPGLLDSSPAAAGAKNKCMHPGCEHPWVYHNGFCYWASQETAALSDAREKCSELNATLASVLDPAENSFLGFHAVQSLTWIGLSDEQSEQIWSWDDKNPSTFRNWGPNEPSGAGDGAVMYPNQWTHSDCNEKKRFLCQARVPSCPTSWYHDLGSKKCYFASSFTADFERSRKICKYLASGGDLATFTAEEAAGVFNREFWANNYADIGNAHYWIGVRRENSSQSWSWVQSEPVQSNPEETYSDWDFPGQTQTNPAFPRCGFVFPTKWSDVDVNLGGSESSGQTLLPAFFCKRFAPEIKNNDTENPLALSDVNNNADTYL